LRRTSFLTSNSKKMKKISFLFVALSIMGLLSINACKSSTQPAQPAETSVQTKVDTLKAAVDSTSAAAADTSDVDAD
jgi:hypothetical protein